MAERVGFEPTVRFPEQRFSRPPLSTAQPPLPRQHETLNVLCLNAERKGWYRRAVSSATEKFRYPWPMLDVVLQGLSILDTSRLDVRTMEEATTFAGAYGFDLSDPSDVDLLWTFFDESVKYLETLLANAEYRTAPEHLRTRKSVLDIRRLVILASDTATHEDQRWACAILRVMHVLVHLQYDPRLRYFEQVQNQILSRLDGHLFTDPESGALYLGSGETGGERIKLLYFKKKDRKDREREIVKLLHKTESLAEEIYDRIGFRLVTETKFDAMRALRLLIDKNVISVANIRPGRSRNRLLDVKRFHFEIDRLSAHVEKSGEDAPYVEKMVRRLERRISLSGLGRSLINPNTSEHYRAIQFTCRELVKVRNPHYRTYDTLRQQLESVHGGLQALQEAFPQPPPLWEHVFFPYEIQIMDVKAYADSVFGRSNHDEYRRKQLLKAQARVFGLVPEKS